MPAPTPAEYRYRYRLAATEVLRLREWLEMILLGTSDRQSGDHARAALDGAWPPSWQRVATEEDYSWGLAPGDRAALDDVSLPADP